ncbi:MAG: hypothetical protein AAB479_00740 [Patescibacteria group bacterium]
MKRLSVQSTVSVVAVLVLAIAGINLFRVINAEQPQDEPTVLKQDQKAISNEAFAYVFPASETSYIPFLDSSRKRPELTARSAIVYDTQSSRFLFAQDTKKRLPIASLTKILSAIVTIEKLNPEDIATVGKDSVRVDGLRRSLEAGEQMRIKNLMKMMLIESSNDAAYAIAAHAKTLGIDFLAEMNKKAEQIAMGESLFLDPAGLNDNGYSTTQDLVRLVVYALRYNEIWTLLQVKEIVLTSEDGAIVHSIENTNELLGTIPNISGGKTGYTDAALGSMILIVDIPGYRDKIVSIILGSKDRFGDTRKLVDWITDAYRWE